LNKESTTHKNINSHAASANAVIRSILKSWGNIQSDRNLNGKKISPALKTEILEQFKKSCAYCNKKLDNSQLVWDHAIPMSRNHCGLHVFGNLVPAHRECNSQKADMTAKEYFDLLDKNGEDTLQLREQLIEYTQEAEKLGIKITLTGKQQNEIQEEYLKISKLSAETISKWREIAAQEVSQS
jgi:HNH endonuclease